MNEDPYDDRDSYSEEHARQDYRLGLYFLVSVASVIGFIAWAVYKIVT